jgi:hypothetical protein
MPVVKPARNRWQVARLQRQGGMQCTGPPDQIVTKNRKHYPIMPAICWKNPQMTSVRHEWSIQTFSIFVDKSMKRFPMIERLGSRRVFQSQLNN